MSPFSTGLPLILVMNKDLKVSLVTVSQQGNLFLTEILLLKQREVSLHELPDTSLSWRWSWRRHLWDYLIAQFILLLLDKKFNDCESLFLQKCTCGEDILAINLVLSFVISIGSNLHWSKIFLFLHCPNRTFCTSALLALEKFRNFLVT